MKIDKNKNQGPKKPEKQMQELGNKNFGDFYMTKEKRDIQILLDELGIEYSQLYQKVNKLDYFVETNSTKCINKNYPKGGPYYQRFNYLKIKGVSKKQIPLLIQQRETMFRYLLILQERINDLSEQFKECK